LGNTSPTPASPLALELGKPAFLFKKEVLLNPLKVFNLAKCFTYNACKNSDLKLIRVF
jgi:hypothetical protein